MKNPLSMIFLFSFFFTTFALAAPSNICRWTSDYSCKNRSLGSSCGESGTCYAKDWTFSEPDCHCYEEPDLKKNQCNAESDAKCVYKFPGPVHRGICKIDDIVFGEPQCIFEEYGS